MTPKYLAASEDISVDTFSPVEWTSLAETCSVYSSVIQIRGNSECNGGILEVTLWGTFCRMMTHAFCKGSSLYRDGEAICPRWGPSHVFAWRRPRYGQRWPAGQSLRETAARLIRETSGRILLHYATLCYLHQAATIPLIIPSIFLDINVECVSCHATDRNRKKVACSSSPPASRRAPDAMHHILLTNEGESVAEVGNCQMLLHMHRGPSKLALTHQALVAREQKQMGVIFLRETYRKFSVHC